LVRHAAGNPAPVPRAFYDGYRKAAQTTALLAAVARGDRIPAASLDHERPASYVEQEVSPS
jgi:hypothetical protein